MHDWYFTLIASAFGEIIFVNKPTMHYRQHDTNIYGAKKLSIIEKLKKLKKDYKDLFSQTETFKSIYYNILIPENKNIIDAFCKMKNSNKLTKLKIIKKYKFCKQSLTRIIAELFFI